MRCGRREVGEAGARRRRLVGNDRVLREKIGDDAPGRESIELSRRGQFRTRELRDKRRLLRCAECFRERFEGEDAVFVRMREVDGVDGAWLRRSALP